MDSLFSFRSLKRCLGSVVFVLVGTAFLVPAQAAAVFAEASMPIDPAITGATSLSELDTMGRQTVSVNLIRSTLYDGTTLYSGVNFTQFELNVPAPGTLMVSLVDLAFPVAAGALSFAIVNGGQVLGVLANAGSLDVAVSGPGKLFAYTYAVGAPGTGIGSYYLNITHEYEDPVPLPASVWLLLSGAAWAGWLGRRKAGSKVA